MQDNNKPVRKNSQARINANNKYKKANYKRIAVDIRPDQAEKIRDTAQRHNLSLAQLIITAVDYFDTNHQPQPQQEQEHTDTQTTGEPDTTTTTSTSNGETEIETETDFDWIDELYKKDKQSGKE